MIINRFGTKPVPKLTKSFSSNNGRVSPLGPTTYSIQLKINLASVPGCGYISFPGPRATIPRDPESKSRWLVASTVICLTAVHISSNCVITSDQRLSNPLIIQSVRFVFFFSTLEFFSS